MATPDEIIAQSQTVNDETNPEKNSHTRVGQVLLAIGNKLKEIVTSLIKFVRVDAAQDFTDAEKAQARSNINSQEKLVSGETIKTINSQSILGAGNIVITGGDYGNEPDMESIDVNDNGKLRTIGLYDVEHNYVIGADIVAEKKYLSVTLKFMQSATPGTAPINALWYNLINNTFYRYEQDGEEYGWNIYMGGDPFVTVFWFKNSAFEWNGQFLEQISKSNLLTVNFYQETSPIDVANAGDLWVNSSNGMLYEFYKADQAPVIKPIYDDIIYKIYNTNIILIKNGNRLSVPQNNKSNTITITYVAWSDEKDANGFYMCDIADDDLIANTGQMIVGSFSNTQSDIVAAAEFQPTEKIFTGVFRLYAKSIPTGDLTFTYKII